MMVWLGIAWKFATSRIGMYIIGTLLVLAALAYVYHRIYSSGEQGAIDSIKEKEGAIVEESETARRTVDDCYAAGRMWSRETGTCLNRVPSVPGQPPGR
jgi:hypothetical protein